MLQLEKRENAGSMPPLICNAGTMTDQGKLQYTKWSLRIRAHILY